ncbi:universal stress protein [Actinospica sp.]|jgi:nucleotide-binding universal stress UspA family protein|uniref:universal stress protein n=1 Tax=Actinospica sp. TaxID=1872142 RepID=UPI002C42A2E9|nr:universal stress protein [Actinospica sp.]HWG22975.1 universal stress protein [Actinospica sp.]
MMPLSVGRVVVGVDGSPGSLHALRRAVEFSRAWQAPLFPVLAWQPPGGEAPARLRQIPELERDWCRGAEDRLNAAFEEGLGAIPLDLDCEPQIVRGPAGPALVQVADRPDDLIVVGSGRHGALARLTHSHIAAYCVAHASCCVIAVPPPPLAGIPRHLRHARRLAA